MADKALSASDANVAFIRQRNKLPVPHLFQLIGGIDADGTFEYRDPISTRMNLLRLVVDGYGDEMRMVLSSVATVAFDLEQDDLDAFRRYLFDFNQDFFHGYFPFPRRLPELLR